MRYSRYLVSICAVFAAITSGPLLAQGTAGAANFPNKPVTIVLPFTPGASTDIETRLYQPRLMEFLKQPMLIDYRPGAGASLGTIYVAKSAPDGYTILAITSGFTVYPAFFPVDKLPYDPSKDFAPLSLINRRTAMLLVHPSLGVKNYQEYIAYARANPGAINFGTSGAGGAVHLPGAWLHNMTNTQATFIHYKGTGPLLPDLVAGRVHATYAFPVVTMPFVKAGKLRALGVTSADRIKNLPDIPAVQEQVPGFDFTSWLGAFVPARTPTAIVNRLGAEFAKMARDPEIVRKLADEHYFVSVGSTPEQFRQYIAPQFDFWRKLVRDNGIKLEE